MPRLRFAVFCALLLCGCQTNLLGGGSAGDAGGGGDPAGDRPPIAGLVGLSVTPPSATLTVGTQAAATTQAFRAVGSFSDGQERDISGEVNWRLDNAAIGALSGAGVFSSSGQAGGVGTVTAQSGGRSASARLEVRFQPVLRAADAPADAEKLLPAGAVGAQGAASPVVVYPSDQTVFPRNIYKVLFQWNAGGSNDLFRLEFRSAYLTLSVYTTADRWEPTAAQWAYMANSNAGGKVTWTVYGVARQSPAVVSRSTSVELGFSQRPVEGAIYYWSTTVAGVRRATVSDTAPQNFYTPDQAGKCVACHTLSRNGQRLAADVGGQTLGVLDVKDLTKPVIDPAKDIDAAWATFNPDTTRIVTASKGVLTLRDGASGAALGAVPVGAGKYGTYPDWSPDGKLLTFALSTSNKDRGIGGASVATIEYNEGAWRNLRVLVASSGNNDNNYYPSFSPDSRWIAFVKASGSSDNNNTARLFLVATDGSKGPLELARANSVVNNQALSGSAAQLGNTMPTWAPTAAGELAFVAFTSLRAYGKVYAVKQQEQLWVAAVDLLGGAADPSAPAFRLPFQELKENTHRPFWAVDALAPPPPPDGGVGGGRDGGTCLPQGTDCRSGAPCCDGLACTPVGNDYQCVPILG